MEPISSAIISALAAGASVALKETASEAIKDSYAALKSLIGNRLTMLHRLERNPTSEATISAAAEEAEESKLADEPEIVEKVRQLVELIAREPRDRLPANIDLERLRAGTDVIVKGNRTSVRARDIEAKGRIEIGDNLGN
jgi:hypothetical protein